MVKQIKDIVSPNNKMKNDKAMLSIISGVSFEGGGSFPKSLASSGSLFQRMCS